jgi:DeoR family fructose operon transcriptional repressor
MFPEERKREILKLLQQHGKVRNLDLSKILGVSEPTIRKDIADLDQENLVIRTHGGAILNESTSKEPNFSDKRDTSHDQKEAIAKLAISLIKPNNTLLLDSGTTTYEIANLLGDIPLTIVTNSLDIAQLLESKPNCEVIVIGGTMRWHTRALVGPIANVTLQRLHVDLAFIGTNAINQQGFSTPNLLEAETKSHMIKASKRAYIVCDSSKIGSTSLIQFASFKELSGLITDQLVPEDFKEHCLTRDFNLLTTPNTSL